LFTISISALSIIANSKGHGLANGNRLWDIAERKHLYFTDELAKGFLNIRASEKYQKGVSQREAALLLEQQQKLCEVVGDKPFNLIDICCGDGEKVIELLKVLPCKPKQIRYVPVNVSKHLVNLAHKRVAAEKFKSVGAYEPHVGEWDGRAVAGLVGRLRNRKYGRNVILLLGSVIASFEINDYLFEVSQGMFDGDYLVIGNGIRTGERLTQLGIYQDKIFRDWSFPLMKYLGFSEKDVSFDARFGNTRVELFYTLKTDKNVKHDGKEIAFKKGDEILVAYLHKYFERELKKFCEMYFSSVELVKDKDSEYALVICKK